MKVVQFTPAASTNLCEWTVQEDGYSRGSEAVYLKVWHAELSHMSTNAFTNMITFVYGLYIRRLRMVKIKTRFIEYAR